MLSPDIFKNLTKSKLRSFSISNCDISLRVLVLNDNMLNSLPDNFHTLQKLQHLEIRNNRLNSLPDNFHTLQKLQYLEIRNNRLNSIT